MLFRYAPFTDFTAAAYAAADYCLMPPIFTVLPLSSRRHAAAAGLLVAAFTLDYRRHALRWRIDRDADAASKGRVAEGALCDGQRSYERGAVIMHKAARARRSVPHYVDTWRRVLMARRAAAGGAMSARRRRREREEARYAARR